MMFDHEGSPVRTGRAAVNGTTLHYRTAGSGPAVVLLHGVPKTSYHWRYLVPKLTPDHTVVVPDLRGLGDSARPLDGYDSATMSDDIAELMMHLGHETYAVAGEDWGAVIGYQLAARHRDRVTALVFAEALFPGFGFEDHTALTPENISSGMHLWHLGFYFQPDVPEMLIAGHERELITYMIKYERSHSTAPPPTRSTNTCAATPCLAESARCCPSTGPCSSTPNRTGGPPAGSWTSRSWPSVDPRSSATATSPRCGSWPTTSPDTPSTPDTTSQRKYPTRWPTSSCRSWPRTSDGLVVVSGGDEARNAAHRACGEGRV